MRSRGYYPIAQRAPDDNRPMTAEQSAKLKQAIMGIDLTRRIAGVVSSAQFFFVSLLLIIAYVGFLLLGGKNLTSLGQVVTAAFLGALLGFLLAIMFTLRQHRRETRFAR